MLLESPNTLCIILISFCKKLYKNEGIHLEEDDIFRTIHTDVRHKVKSILNHMPEVRGALSKIFPALHDLTHDKICSFYTFIVKGGIDIGENELKQIARAFKKSLIQLYSNSPRDLLVSVGIFLRLT